MLDKGYSQRSIAKTLGKVPSAINYELKTNKKKDGIYDPRFAQQKAGLRRRNASFKGKKILSSYDLRSFVEKNLVSGQTPSAIAGRLKLQEKNLPYVSKDSVYRYKQSVYGKALGLKKRKKKRKYGYKKKYEIKNRKFIDKRPESINLRKNIGDCEGDFIVSGKGGKRILLVVVDRRLRISFLELILKVTIKNVHKSFLQIKKAFPEMKSLTLDNDILFRHHKALERLLDVDIYFCRPYHSWEKGSVENVNKYIRKFIPKGSDLSKYSIDEIKTVEQELNTRFMECLNYETPQEVLDRYRRKQKNNNC